VYLQKLQCGNASSVPGTEQAQYRYTVHNPLLKQRRFPNRRSFGKFEQSAAVALLLFWLNSGVRHPNDSDRLCNFQVSVPITAAPELQHTDVNTIEYATKIGPRVSNATIATCLADYAKEKDYLDALLVCGCCGVRKYSHYDVFTDFNLTNLQLLELSTAQVSHYYSIPEQYRQLLSVYQSSITGKSYHVHQ
jgi:hypothetical protein